MRIALIADVHANLAALVAVLKRVREQAPDACVCLGDLVGYNAEPAECIDLLRDAEVAIVAGNHDLDVATGGRASGTAAVAAIAQEWSRGALGDRHRAFLAGLPRSLVPADGVKAIHGSFLNDHHTSGYVTSTMLADNLFALRDRWASRVGMCGHTHVPMVGWLAGDSLCEPRPTDEIVWPAGADAVLVNPGSVGQPRDGDCRASFAIVDLARRAVRFERVPYDLSATVRAIGRAGLPRVLADRLREGR
jgi:diadenosine tetraphosphatase ApaH/serine/threonine PP2A family protein phosphatase